MFSNSGSIQQAMEILVCAKDSQSFQVATSMRARDNRYADLNAGSCIVSMKKKVGRLCGNRFFLRSTPAEDLWN